MIRASHSNAPEQPEQPLSPRRRNLLRAALGASAPAWLLAGCGGGQSVDALQDEGALALDTDEPDTTVALADSERVHASNLARTLPVGRVAFEARRAAALEAWRGRSLTLRYPATGRGGYVRPVAYDYLTFALCAFFNNERLDGANSAVLQHNALYKGRRNVLDNPDNFYWAIGLLFQCIEYFGANGSVAPGRLSASAESDSLDVLAEWVRSHARLVDAAPGHSLIVKGSENHHVQDAYCKWHASKLLAASPAHQDLAYGDNGLPAAHEVAWAGWLEDWMIERVRHGLLIEYGGDAYGATTLKGLYNVAAFGRSAHHPRLSRVAEMFINVFWADWAQDHQAVMSATREVTDIVRGGAKARVYPGHESLLGRPVTKWINQQTNPLQQLVYFYTGLGPPDTLLEADALQMVCSGILPRSEILDVFSERDTTLQRRESFVRVHGRFQRGRPRDAYYILRNEGLVRYSYREPDFVLGSILCDARVELDWAMISSQNRWTGAVLSSHVHARVLFTCEAPFNQRHYNAFWSVQKRGALIAQKLPGTGGISGQMSKYAGPTRIWVPRAGQVWRTESRNGWVLLDYGSARVGLFVVGGGWRWVAETDQALDGQWLVPLNENAAVVMEVVSQSRMRYRTFVDVLSTRAPTLSADGRVRYASLYGDRLELDTTCASLPLINRRPIDLKPSRALNSPILKSVWGAAGVTFRYGGRSMHFDFEAARVTGESGAT